MDPGTQKMGFPHEIFPPKLYFSVITRLYLLLGVINNCLELIFRNLSPLLFAIFLNNSDQFVSLRASLCIASCLFLNIWINVSLNHIITYTSDLWPPP